MNPQFPIYIPSRGRHESRLTVKELERINVPFKVIVEQQEFDKYAAVIDPEKIIVLPKSNQGLVYARNWIWDHAQASGAAWYWMLDDNIQAFWRLNNNLRIRVADGTIFKCCEDFVSRYENIAISGMQYYMFCPDRMRWPAFVTNTRVYSCFLNRTDIPFRYEPGFNDDTDLSIRILKAGWCTVLFNAFLAQKAATMTVKGGLTEHYKAFGRKEISEDIVRRHPDCTQLIYRWNRWHHFVDYKKIGKAKLIRKSSWNYSGVNNYGMELVEIKKPAKVESLAQPKKPSKPFDPDYWKKQGFKRDPKADIQNL